MAAPSADPITELSKDGAQWLLTPEEVAALGSTGVGEAERVLSKLWTDPRPDTAENEMRLAVASRSRLWRREFLSALDARAGLVFVRGLPAGRRISKCPEVLAEIEAWAYPGIEFLLVRRPGDNAFELWTSAEGKRALYTPAFANWLEDWQSSGRPGRRLDREVCADTGWLDKLLSLPTAAQRDFEDGAGASRTTRAGGSVRAERIAPPEDRSRWAAQVLAAPEPAKPDELGRTEVTLRPIPDGPMGAVRADVNFLEVERLKVGEKTAEGMSTGVARRQRLLAVDGVIERQGRIVDAFRNRFEIAAERPVSVSVLRRVRPGEGYLLRLRVRDELGGGEAWFENSFDLPAGEAASEPVSTPLRDEGRLLGADTLQILPPESDVILGLWRPEVVLTGSRIRRVAFWVDGELQATRTQPPWTAELRLPSLPREIAVRAEGLTIDGTPVAADTVTLNQLRGNLEVQILEPRRGLNVQGRFTARAQVVVPEGGRVERVEFRLGERLVSTLTAAPWIATLEAPADPAAFLAVAAVLEDGGRAEDVRFLHPGGLQETVDVDLVELYTSVLDPSGAPVTGLAAPDFEILENGKPQKLSRFETVVNQRLTLGVVLDTSGSMLESLGQARVAASSFVRALMKPGDRAFAVSFAERPILRMPRTEDPEAVVRALDGLSALGATALHDAVAHALYYFRGTRGQRALVLLSDGDDTSSLVKFEDSLAAAHESGVAIYTIGLGLSVLDVSARHKLERFAADTGGRSFFVKDAADLAPAYAEIERELRSQYLLAYQSNAADPKGFRAVEVRAKRSGLPRLKARTMRGYTP
jgi:Ca-activated chloride channel family protein